MDEKIRIVHSADWHLGVMSGPRVANELPLMFKSVLDAANELANFVEENNVDLVILSGDILNRGNPAPLVLNSLSKILKKIVDTGAKVVFLIGNHEVPGWGEHPLKIYEILGIEDIIVADDATVYNLELKNTEMQIATIPYNTLHNKQFEDIVSELSKEINPLNPSILVTHIFVRNARLSGSDLNLLPDEPHTYSDIFLKLPFDYVALGHIHKFQKILARPIVIYPGSIQRMNFSEAMDEKGFIYAEFSWKKSRWNIEWRFQPVDTLRFRTIDIDIRNQENPTLIIMKKIESYKLLNEMVRIKITRTQRDLKPNIKVIRKRITDMGALYCKIDYNTVTETLEKHVDSKVGIEKGDSISRLHDYITKKRPDLIPERNELINIAKDILKSISRK